MKLRLAGALAIVSMLAACGAGSVAPAALPTKLIKADVARASPTDGAPDVSVLVAADTRFAFDLYEHLSAADGANSVFSPYSIATALTMVYAGARGDTATQLAGALGIGALGARVQDARSALDQAIAAPRTDPHQKGDYPTIDVVNSLWGQAGFYFLAPFLDTLARDYAAGMNTVDFEQAAEGARVAINKWVADHTDGKITELLPAGTVDDLTRFVIVNAVLFKASWLQPFKTADTTNGKFTRTDGSTVQVPMMHAKQRESYVHVDGWQEVRVPYLGRASMVFLLPDKAGATLTGSVWNALAAAPGEAEVTLTVPKFTFGASTDLEAVLPKLGISDLVDANSADLSGVDGRGGLYIAAAQHQATISLDEHGTEATAATGLVGELTSAVSPATITLDRPFSFAIQDDVTHEILFLGRVADPSVH